LLHVEKDFSGHNKIGGKFPLNVPQSYGPGYNTTSRAGHENRMMRIRVQPWPRPGEIRMRCGLHMSSN